MSIEIQYLKHSTGTKLSYFVVENTTWFSSAEIAKLLDYSNGRAAIRRYVSAENIKTFKEFHGFFDDVKTPLGIKSNKNFINFKGFQELLENTPDQRFPKTLKSESEFFSTFFFSLPEQSFKEPELKFSKLAEIPETITKPLEVHGYLYLLKTGNLGKVGKTRCVRNRKLALKQKFQDAEIIWFVFCQNIDLLEQEILQKLDYMGALVKNQSSVEIFDPNIISFNEIQQELIRLSEHINSQYLSQPTEKVLDKKVVQQEYLKFANSIVEALLPFANEDPKAFIDVVEKILQGFEKI